MRIYRSLQILTTQFNNSCRWLYLPAIHVFVLITPIVGIFVSVKFHEKLPIPYIITFASSALSCFMYDFVTYPIFGNVYEMSRVYVGGVGDQSLSKEWRMTKRSMAVLAVKVRDNYIMQRHTLLTVISLIVNQTANLLVSF